MATTPASSFHSDDYQLNKRVKTESVAWPSPATTVSDADEADDTISQAYDVIYKASCGLYPEENPTFSLSQRSFETFLDRIQQRPEIEAFFGSVRYDWDGEELTLILMEHPLHGVFKSLFDRELYRKLDRIADNPDLEPFCKKIIPAGTSAVELLTEQGMPKIHKCPCSQTLYKGYRRPPLVTEVAWSHKDLKEKGRQYLSQFDGEVTTFVGFDLTYAPPEGRKVDDYHYDGSVIVWTLQETRDSKDVGQLRAKLRKPQVFRSQSTAVPGVLELQFAWLLPLEERVKLPPEQAVLRFDHTELAQLLAEAESTQRECDATPPPRRRKRVISFEDDEGNILSDGPSHHDDEPEPELKRRRQSQPDPSSRITRSRSRMAEDPLSLRTQSKPVAEGSASIQTGSESR
ncbi:hypothetical protein FHL15_007995 [Xylaria flabelliformis]|uniref:Uncharacterized protein n=1 Tax=Xylaria flabelliformis TaxID=2512241 RepID=A0A553HST7_9PEZI|nr:hypothetical protein FHL15_007995 [Xylaria flabelliformis]